MLTRLLCAVRPYSWRCHLMQRRSPIRLLRNDRQLQAPSFGMELKNPLPQEKCQLSTPKMRIMLCGIGTAGGRFLLSLLKTVLFCLIALIYFLFTLNYPLPKRKSLCHKHTHWMNCSRWCIIAKDANYAEPGQIRYSAKAIHMHLLCSLAKDLVVTKTCRDAHSWDAQGSCWTR